MSDANPSAAPPHRCPRCGNGFDCGARDPTPCACSALKLAPALLQGLRLRYAGCLCLRCLADLAAEGCTIGDGPTTPSR